MNDIFDMWKDEDDSIVAHKDCDSYWRFESKEEIDEFISCLKILSRKKRKGVKK